MGFDSLEVICALVIGLMVMTVTILIIAVKTLTVLIYITRRKDLYICPGHRVKNDHPIGRQNEYDIPGGINLDSHYAPLVSDELKRNNSRTDQKQVFETPMSSMQEPVYHDIAPAQPSSGMTPITQRNNMRRSQTTVV